MAKNIGEAKLNLYLAPEQVELLQKMVDAGMYGTISVPNATGGYYRLSHMAMNAALSHVAMNSALRHVAMNSPLKHVAMNAPLAHVAMNAPIEHIAMNSVLKK
jgi:hypothetical protein